MNHIDGVTLSTQATTQRLGQFPLIFNNQQPHRAILAAPSPKILKSTSACDKGQPLSSGTSLTDTTHEHQWDNNSLIRTVRGTRPSLDHSW